MLKNIIALWRGKGFMGTVIGDFGEMLSDAEYIFTHAWRVFKGELAVEDVKQTLYDKDILVNKHERGIRRKLVEHLSINPRQDVSACLVVMSLVKDAERIGDYSKNIFDLGAMLKGRIENMGFLEQLSITQERIAANFPRLKKAFLDSNENLAKEILKEYTPIKDSCNKILQDIFTTELSSKEAVAIALLSRYLKRINSHMSNVASGIVYPLDRIDFVRGDLSE